MNKLWGGRFKSQGMSPEVMDFTESLSIDYVLVKYDCTASKVHAETLLEAGYITKEEKNKICLVLDELLTEIENGTISFKGHEDIHSAVQSYVEEKAPLESKKMHTGRSRNEQVVNDVRLYCKDNIDAIVELIENLQSAIVKLAKNNLDVIMPGYTHLNHAQPILFSHLVMSYVEMLERDKTRLLDAKKRSDISVMGSGAIAGSALNLDRFFTAKKLCFSSVSNNSIDSVSDRDFMAEFLSALAIIGVHLSRMSEDLILYSTAEFAFVDISEKYCTGSSLMPQKKNADVLELIRGKSAQLIGSLNSLLVLLKGLPHAYNRDLQDDKKYLFESVELVKKELVLFEGIISTLKVDKDKTAQQLKDEFIYATDLAEYLVRKGVAFKEAHDIVGSIIKCSISENIRIADMPLKKIKEFSKEFDKDVFDLLDPIKSVSGKKTYGSTNPVMVKKEIFLWNKKMEK
ncbi:MAG: argininosuccinate lyase [Candidatus Omnitrophica bacterium]|nr:argininosuccinate lyase [Candidatus Omnitrophota bacterium]